MLLAYLPKEKIVIEADLFDPPGPAAASAENKALHNHVRRLDFDVATIAPIHGRAVPWSDFLKVIGDSAQ
jgi:hypothetical protein